VSAEARLVRTYLLALPLVRWLAAAGALVMALALIGGVKGSVILGLGSLLAVAAPAMLLGPAVRIISSGSSVRLRPAAHRKLLGMMCLVVVLLTLVMVVPQWLLYNLGALPAQGDARGFLEVTSSLRFAMGTWSVLSLMALLFFFVTVKPGHSFAFALLVMLWARFGGRWLDGLSLPFLTLPLTALAGWCAFSLWFLRGPRLASITQRLLQAAGGGRNADFLIRTLQKVQDTGSTGRQPAIRAYLLGSPSLKGLLWASLVVLLPMAPMFLLQMSSHRGPRWFDALSFIGLFPLAGVTQALAATRRARALWLRAGLNRSGLFNLVERELLAASTLVLAPIAVPLGVLSVWGHPQLLAATLCYIAAMAMIALVGMYYAMSLVQRMTFLDYALGMIGLLAWLPLVALLLPAFGSPLRSIATTAVAALVAYALRIYAQRRWEHLDWRVLRPLLRVPGSRI